MTLQNFSTYIINLDERKDRFFEIQSQLKNTNNYFRLSAVNGSNNEGNFKEKRYFENSRKHLWCDEMMSSQEIGCLLSHMKVMEDTISDDSPDYILIVEDDANFLAWSHQEAEKFLIENYFKFECIQLSFMISKENIEELQNYYKGCPSMISWNEMNHKKFPWGFFWSTTAYLINKEARKKVLQKFNQRIDFLRPSDFYIYESINTMTLIPPIIIQDSDFTSTIQNCTMHHVVSNRLVTDIFHRKKLVLITFYFGKLPTYFAIFFKSIENKSFDVILVTDQNLDTYNIPLNVKHIHMTFEHLNQHLSTILNKNIKLDSPIKLVDVKPLYGKIVEKHIKLTYDFWGWTDNDMILGDIEGFIESMTFKYDIYSFGNVSFGPMMIFKIDKINIYQTIDYYEEILNNPIVCKIDEFWFFEQFDELTDMKIYYDIDKPIIYSKRFSKFYNYLKEYTNIYIFQWKERDCGIDWEVKNVISSRTKLENWIYELKNNKLYINGKEIAFSHLTLLKRYPNLLKNVTGSFVLQFSFKDTTDTILINQTPSIYEIYETYLSLKVESLD